MKTDHSRMWAEAAEAPCAVDRLLAAETAALLDLGAQLRAKPPKSVLTIARGSSDHAAHYAAYLIMARLGQPVTSLPMSVMTLYDSPMAGDGVLALALSQSGQSPDLVLPLSRLLQRGARTLALVNDGISPLALAAQQTILLRAGVEASVAATKSFICQMAAGAALVAAWQGDARMLAALHGLPHALGRAWANDWLAGCREPLISAERLFVVSRGAGMAVALEAALKFKEVCGIQAEAFSGAEVQHGPMALVQQGFPMLVLAPRGPAHEGLVALTHDMRLRGAHVLLAAPAGTPGCDLPITATDHIDLDPIAMAQSFYGLVEALARARKRDPDVPPHLKKVTRTE